MRFLFIVQGEGRGHLTQAIALSGILRDNGHEVIETLVGCSEMRQIPAFFFERMAVPVHTYPSPNFLKTRDQKHIRIFQSFVYNLRRHRRKSYFNSLRFIAERIRQSKPDVVINFYELLGGLAYKRYRIQTPMVCVAHQFVYEHPAYHFGYRLQFTHRLLKWYTALSSLCAHKRVALSLTPMCDDADKKIFVAPPLLRSEVLQSQPTTQPYLLGYILNHGFSDEIIRWHRQHMDTVLHVFWDHPDMSDTYEPHANMTFHRINDTQFIQMMAHCTAFFGTAGFESIGEAMYLGKPIWMVPVHAEQEMNATDAMRTGAVMVGSSFDLDKLIEDIPWRQQPHTDFKHWVDSATDVWLSILSIKN